MAELYIARNAYVPDTRTSLSSAVITLTSNNFVYDGNQKTQGIDSVVVNGQTLTENVDYTVINNIYTNAGDYTLKVMGMGNYKGTATASWSITKATGSVGVSPSSLNIMGIGASDTATLTVVGDGAISVVSSDTDVATVERSGNTVTVTSVGGGTANITITLAAGANYMGDSATLIVEVSVPNPILANNNPEMIQAAAQAGNASALWSVGATTGAISFQNVTVGSLSMNGLSACAFIIGFDHNSSKEGTGIHFQFGKTIAGVDIAFCDSYYSYYGSSSGSTTYYKACFKHNNSDSYGDNIGGWNSSYIRSTICPAFLSALPTVWQNVIVSTDKYTDNAGGGSGDNVTQTATSDKIWLLSEYEVFGTKSYAASTESSAQAQYDYYKNGNSKIKYKHNTTSTVCVWWLRSPSSGPYIFCGVGPGGDHAYSYSSYSWGFAPGFRVA